MISTQTRKGFSLIELLLVIFIISLVYFLGFDVLGSPKKRSIPLTPETLKTEIIRSNLFQGSGTLLCTDACTKCYFRKDVSSDFKPYEGKIALKGTKVYTLNRDRSLDTIEYGRYRDHKICLLMDFYPNGSTTKLVLETPKGVFLIPSYLGEVQKFTSLDEAQETWLRTSQLISKEGEFY